jgi:hypothetical protein
VSKGGTARGRATRARAHLLAPRIACTVVWPAPVAAAPYAHPLRAARSRCAEALSEAIAMADEWSADRVRFRRALRNRQRSASHAFAPRLWRSAREPRGRPSIEEQQEEVGEEERASSCPSRLRLSSAARTTHPPGSAAHAVHIHAVD